MEKNKREKYFSDKNKVDSKIGILCEISDVLDIQEKGFQLDILHSFADHEKRIPNRDIYKLYLCLLDEFDAERRIVYTGRGILENKELKDMKESREELEPSL